MSAVATPPGKKRQKDDIHPVDATNNSLTCDRKQLSPTSPNKLVFVLPLIHSLFSKQIKKGLNTLVKGMIFLENRVSVLCWQQKMKTENAIKLGRIVQTVRVDNGFTLRGFAKHCVKEDGKAIAISTLQRIESGDPPRTQDVLLALARNPYISKNYSYSELSALLAEEEDLSLSRRKVFSSHQILPYLEEMPDSEKIEVIEGIVKSLSIPLLRQAIDRLMDIWFEKTRCQ